MQLILNSSHIDGLPALKEFTLNKFNGVSKFLKRWENLGEIILRVEIARTTNHHQKGEVFYAEANLELPSHVLRAEVKNKDIRVAINEARKKLELLIRKEKTKNEVDTKSLRLMRGKVA